MFNLVSKNVSMKIRDLLQDANAIWVCVPTKLIILNLTYGFIEPDTG